MDLFRAVQRAKFNNADCDGELVAFARGFTSAWQSYMAAALAAHGAGFIRPKHHYGGHIALQFLRDGGEIFDTFIVERLHRRSRLHARHLVTHESFERTGMTRIVATHCYNDTIDPSSRIIRSVFRWHWEK